MPDAYIGTCPQCGIELKCYNPFGAVLSCPNYKGECGKVIRSTYTHRLVWIPTRLKAVLNEMQSN